MGPRTTCPPAPSRRSASRVRGRVCRRGGTPGARPAAPAALAAKPAPRCAQAGPDTGVLPDVLRVAPLAAAVDDDDLRVYGRVGRAEVLREIPERRAPDVVLHPLAEDRDHHRELPERIAGAGELLDLRD